jgi:hypothetical protein
MKINEGHKIGFGIVIVAGAMALGTLAATGAYGPASADDDQEIVEDQPRQFANLQTRLDLACDQLAAGLGVERPQARDLNDEFDFVGGMTDPLWPCAEG